MNVTLKELLVSTLLKIDIKKIKMRSGLSTLLCLLIVFLSCGSDKDVLDDIIDETPTTPTNFTFSNVTLNSVLLSWGASTDEGDNIEYNIYQNSTLISKVEGTSYLIEGLLPDTEYTFTVSAIDTAGNESPQSDSISVTTQEEVTSDTESPTIPTGLSASNLGQTGVDISWSASTDNVEVTGYTVYLDGNAIGTTASTSFSVTGLIAATTYDLTVSALDAAENESAQSQALEVTTESTSLGAKVLVFTKTSGFDHGTREESEAMVQTIATQLGFEFTVDNTGSEFDSASNLNNYDVIFFTNTSGDMLNASQRSNVESYASQGGNFISNHAASDAYGHSTASSVSGNGKGVWDWYAENVTGCSVRNNPNHTSSGFGATVSIQNTNTQLTNGISFPWSDNEEWYYWEDGYIDSSFTELLRVSDTGSNSYDDARMTAHYWNRADGGKSFYTSMGHASSKYTDAEFVQLITNAFAFMLP